MRHLLEVRGNVRVIAREVNVVELNVDDVLDVAVRRVQRALAAGACWDLRRGGTRLGLGRTGKETRNRGRNDQGGGQSGRNCFASA